MPQFKKGKAAEAADIVDKLFAEIDPEVMLAAGLGAVAAGNGVVPPLTRILMSFTDDSSIASELVNDYKTLLIAGTGIGPVWAVFANLFERGDDGGSSGSSPPNNVGVAASGALEAMIVMSAVKNPAVVKAVGDIAKEAISAAKGIL